MLWYHKGQYHGILAKWLRFQDNFKFQDNSEISEFQDNWDPWLFQCCMALHCATRHCSNQTHWTRWECSPWTAMQCEWTLSHLPSLRVTAVYTHMLLVNVSQPHGSKPRGSNLYRESCCARCNPHTGTSSSISDSPIPSPITFSSPDSPLCSSMTPHFHSQLKTYLFHKSYPP